MHQLSMSGTLLLACTLATQACSGSGGHDVNQHRADFRLVQRATSSPSLELSFVMGMDVDSRGNVYVGDANSVVELAPDGKLLRRIGREGNGPGEFQRVNVVRLLPGDSLFVFDAGATRVTVFGPGADRAAYTVDVGTRNLLFPYWASPVPAQRALVAAYRSAYGATVDGSPRGKQSEFLRLLNGDASLRRDSVLSFPEYEAIPLMSGGQTRGELFNPFGRHMLLQAAGDRVYTAWTGDWKIDVHSVSGEKLGTIVPSVSANPRPITSAEMDSVIGTMTIPGFGRATIERAMAGAGNKTWPLLRDMVVDDVGHVWLAATGLRGEPVHWIGFDEHGARVGAFDLPENVTIRVLRNHVAYGVRLDENDVPHVVVYDLQPAHPDPRTHT